jgi:hypothetical protein
MKQFKVCVLSYGGMGSRYVCSRLARSQRNSISSRIKNSEFFAHHTHDINDLYKNFNRYVILYNDPLKAIISRGKRGLLLRFWKDSLLSYIDDEELKSRIPNAFQTKFQNWKREKKQLDNEEKNKANEEFLKELIVQSGLYETDFSGIFSFYQKAFNAIQTQNIPPQKVFFADFREQNFLLTLSNVVKHDISKHFQIKPRKTNIDNCLQEMGISLNDIQKIKQYYFTEDENILKQYNSSKKFNELTFVV